MARKIFILLAVVFVIAVIANIGNKSSTTTSRPQTAQRATAEETKPRNDHPIFGENGVLRSGDGSEVPVAANQGIYERLQDLADVNDVVGIKQLMGTGNIWLVNSGTRVHVIDTHWMRFEVRILDGNRAGRSGFVKREFVWKW